MGDLPARGVGVNTAFDFGNSFFVVEDQHHDHDHAANNDCRYRYE
jgi:hypothetical protein